MLLLQTVPKLCYLRSLRRYTRLATCTTVKDSIFCNACRTKVASNVRHLSYSPSLNKSKDRNLKKEGKFEEIQKQLQLYKQLSKVNLTLLVTMTAWAGYALAPGPIDCGVLTCTFLGTFLCSVSANSFNHFLEAPYDSQMPRAKDRPLPTGSLRPESAISFAIGSGIAGFTLLLSTVNLETALLGLANIVLYAGVYTPLKRTSIANTWIGAVVGAIPPLMGWVAKTGYAGMDISALILPLMMYSWQFYHFNALSWKYRPDYSRAGYRMMSVTDPDLCRRVALRHNVLQLVYCVPAYFLLPYGLYYVAPAVAMNLVTLIFTWRFYSKPTQRSGRHLFGITVFTWFLFMPYIIILGTFYNDIPKIYQLVAGLL